MGIVTKIRGRFNVLSVAILVIFLSIPCGLTAQGYVDNPPPVTKNWQAYKKQVKGDPAKEMVELKSLIPALIYDLRYASTDNFMHRLMYPANTTTTFLRRPAAEALLNVQRELKEKNIGIKIFDAYRPYSVTIKFWELVKDDRYVANPAKGSGHNRGIAVDLTLFHLQDSTELDMGTDFDNFSDTAHHSFTQLPDQILQNRKLLRSVMEKYGFKALETEWWHYFLGEGEKFELLDIDFETLKK